MLNFDNLSFYNLVIFYSEELNKIKKGARASSVLSMQDRKRLSKHGILIFIIPKRGCWNLPSRVLYPSCLTLMILDGLLSIFDFME